MHLYKKDFIIIPNGIIPSWFIRIQMFCLFINIQATVYPTLIIKFHSGFVYILKSLQTRTITVSNIRSTLNSHSKGTFWR